MVNSSAIPYTCKGCGQHIHERMAWWHGGSPYHRDHLPDVLTLASLRAENERLRSALYECANLARGWTDRKREAPDYLESVYRVACEATGETPKPLIYEQETTA